MASFQHIHKIAIYTNVKYLNHTTKLRVYCKEEIPNYGQVPYHYASCSNTKSVRDAP